MTVATTACETLFRQCVDRYRAQAAEGRLAKWVVGVTAAEQRVEIDLDALDLGPFEKDKLVRCTLEAEGAERYVYATNVRVVDEESHKISERVMIVCATATDYIGGDWGVTRSAKGTITLRPLGEWSGRDPEKTPGTWYLTEAIALTPDERERYAALWAELRERRMASGASP
jgi:hypothetical protein